MAYRGVPSAFVYTLRAVRRVRRPGELSPGLVAAWPGHRADRRQLRAWLAATGLPAGPALHILYPYTFGFRLAMSLLTHPSAPVPIWKVLQVRATIRQYSAIEVDAPLDFETRWAAGRPVAKGAEFDLDTTASVAGMCRWESRVTFYSRGAYGEPAAVPPVERAPGEFGPERARWTPRDAHHLDFARYTGDYNPLHFADGYARRHGFAGALFHPPRMLAECVARLPEPGGNGPARVDAWFKGPVLHRREVVLRGGSAADPGAFALHLEPARPALVGRLESHGR
jgi:hypothetical protein